MESMASHALLLTGPPGIGKTTVIKKIAESLYGRRIRGFVTGELREKRRRVGFEIRGFDGQAATLAHVDLKSRHRVGRYGVDVEALDRIVESALFLDNEVDVDLISCPPRG